MRRLSGKRPGASRATAKSSSSQDRKRVADHAAEPKRLEAAHGDEKHERRAEPQRRARGVGPASPANRHGRLGEPVGCEGEARGEGRDVVVGAEVVEAGPTSRAPRSPGESPSRCSGFPCRAGSRRSGAGSTRKKAALPRGAQSHEERAPCLAPVRAARARSAQRASGYATSGNPTMRVAVMSAPAPAAHPAARGRGSSHQRKNSSIDERNIDSEYPTTR